MTDFIQVASLLCQIHWANMSAIDPIYIQKLQLKCAKQIVECMKQNSQAFKERPLSDCLVLK